MSEDGKTATLSIYHIDSVESTSKWGSVLTAIRAVYTILTLWSQLQNECNWLPWRKYDIPYWLCGVNFKIIYISNGITATLYHIDSVESTSKSVNGSVALLHLYTILTLWSQLQNTRSAGEREENPIPYWLCGVNFKMRGGSHCALPPVYHIDSVESPSKSGGETKMNFFCIPYWLCGVNFKIPAQARHKSRIIYHIDSVESTSKFARAGWRIRTKIIVPNGTKRAIRFIVRTKISYHKEYMAHTEKE